MPSNQINCNVLIHGQPVISYAKYEQILLLKLEFIFSLVQWFISANMLPKMLSESDPLIAGNK